METQFVPIEVVARRFTVSISTIRAWLRQGFIPKHTYVKIGGTYRFDVEKVILALTTQPKTPETPESDEIDPTQLDLDFNDNPDTDV